jgi:branched-chain amino acid transport system permease protein
VTIALTIGAIPLANWIWDPSTPRTFDKFFGATKTVTIFGSKITYHELLALVLAVVVVGVRRRRTTYRVVVNVNRSASRSRRRP